MAREQLERLLAEVAALADRLGENIATLTGLEVDEMLTHAGYDPDMLRQRLHQGAQTLAARLRRDGKPVPRYLGPIIDATAPLEMLAARNRPAALKGMRKWFREVAEAVAAGAPVPQESLSVVRAYRKTADLTPQDARLLDQLEEELRRGSVDQQENQGGDDQTR